MSGHCDRRARHSAKGRWAAGRSAAGRRAFSLIEVIVVIGIVMVLLGLLFPTLHGARAASKAVACQSNMRQIGIAMAAYAGENRGWLFPPDAGNFNTLAPVGDRWFQHVLKTKPPLNPASADMRDWTPPVMLCPADDESPGEYHSYVLNGHLVEKKVRYFSKNFGGNITATDVVVMGEKVTTEDDYYVERSSSGQSDYHLVVEHYRHGLRLQSHYLHLDLHVDNVEPKRIDGCIDPWDVLPAVEPVVSP